MSILVALALVAFAGPSAASAHISIENFTADVLDRHGNPETQAGAHPFVAENAMTIPIDFDTLALPLARDIVVDMPVGFSGDASRVPTCSLDALTIGTCPRAAQIGMFTLMNVFLPPTGSVTPIYNLEAPRGQPARFGTQVAGMGMVYFDVSIRPEDNGIRVISPDNAFTSITMVQDVKVELWGIPADPDHDADRGGPAGTETVPFLTMPTHCDGQPFVTRVRARSWGDPEFWAHAEYAGPPITGCDAIDFHPELKVQPQSPAPDTPSGYIVELTQELPGSAEALASAHLKDVAVSLPEGVSINPAAAAGLESCTEAQIGLGKDGSARCPTRSIVGEVTIETPLLDEPLIGPVYQAEQDANPFGSTFALYMAPESERYGVRMKLAGEVKADPVTGQLTTTFRDNPQQPFSKMILKLKGGPQAVLSNPATCGPKTTEWAMTSWAQPDNAVTGSDLFSIDCVPGMLGFSPSFSAGTALPAAGAQTPFILDVARQGGERELKGFKVVRLPEGLLGHVGLVPLCEAAAADTGSCLESSKVGRVETALGAGPTPLWMPQTGKEPTGVYLAGPYKGAPYSLSIVVPAQAGPFDLGRVVVRSALHVDDRTTQITTGIDESRLIDPDGTVTEVLPDRLPRILKGIVLNQREIRVILDRDGFMVNPTDCSPAQITAEIHAYGGGKADVASRFQVGECGSLGFAPRFRAQILNKGRKSTLRSFHPRTRFAVVPRAGDANIGAARVVLPSSTLLDQANIGTTCTRADMAANDCPEASIVGYARAWSPLLQRPVQGPVYLAANGGVRPLPDLAAVMDGEIRVILQGEISTRRGGGKARLENTFRVVPDAPVSRFVLTIRGGAKRGLLVNSTDLCRTNERGVAVFHGQNGKRHRLRPRIATSFRGCAKVRRQAARKAAQRKMARKAAVAVRKAMR